MKTSARFAAVCFGLQILFEVVIYILFPKLYPGDSFTIIWFYVINFGIAVLVFPLFFLLLKRIYIKREVSRVMAYFLCVFVIVNLLPLLTEHIFWTGKLFVELIKSAPLKIIALIEFINPILSYVLTFFIFRKSDLWSCKEVSQDYISYKRAM